MVLASFLLSLREGLEAALIIGIVMGVLERLDQQHLKSVVWQGVLAAVLGSLLVGLGLNLFGAKLEGKAEQAFEGLALFVAAGVLTWMIIWMQRQGRHMRSGIEAQTAGALHSGRRALFLLAFVAVFREGLELALFLLAASFVSGGASLWTGSALGLAQAALLGWVLYSTTHRLSLRGFFRITNLLLIIFAAGMVAYGVHEFNELGWIPALVDPLWDTNYILSDTSDLGLALKALFGYNGNPSLTEVLAYLSFLGVLLINYARFQRRDLAGIPVNNRS